MATVVGERRIRPPKYPVLERLRWEDMVDDDEIEVDADALLFL